MPNLASGEDPGKCNLLRKRYNVICKLQPVTPSICTIDYPKVRKRAKIRNVY